MFNVTEWELFYTVVEERDWTSEWLVDQIYIDKVNRRYMLDRRVPDHVTDGFDVFGNEIFSMGVSRLVFDIILNGVRESGFKECKHGDV